jgi:hypothetical protein
MEGEDPPHRRMHLVRNKLRVLDYEESLGMESLDLVERLLGDLIATTESYEKLQQQGERVSNDLALAQVRYPLP